MNDLAESQSVIDAQYPQNEDEVIADDAATDEIPKESTEENTEVVENEESTETIEETETVETEVIS